MQRDHTAPIGDALIASGEARTHPTYLLFLLLLVGMVNMMDRQILSIFIIPIQEEFGVGDSAMGLLTGFAFSLFYVLAGLPIARWLDIGNRRNILAGAIVVWSAATALCGLTVNFIQLLIARIGVASGEAAANPGVVSIAADSFPATRRARAISIYYVGNSLGVFLGLSVGGWLAATVGWRIAFIVVGIPGLLLAILVRYTMKEPPRSGTRDANGDEIEIETISNVIRYLVSLPTYRLLVASSVFFTLVAYGLLSWSATFFLRVHEMNPASVGLWLGLASGIGLVSGNLLGGFLSDYLATRNLRWYVLVPAIANLLTIPGILIFLLTESTTIALLAYVPTLMLTGSVTPPLIAAIMAISKPRMRALSYSAYYMTAVVIGMGGGPFIMGFMADFFSTQYQTEAIRYAMLYTSLSALFLATSGLFLASLSINRDKAE